jgi:hypothetical protein
MTRICVVAADGAKARFFVSESVPDAPHREHLAERSALVNPERKVPGKDWYSNVRSGSNRAPHGATYEYDDHRERHLAEVERRFARALAEIIGEFVRRENASKLVLAVDSRMLGLLRERVPEFVPEATEILEVATNVAALAPAAIHSLLSKQGVFPTHAPA